LGNRQKSGFAGLTGTKQPQKESNDAVFWLKVLYAYFGKKKSLQCIQLAFIT
jgi:hypothetical protein